MKTNNNSNECARSELALETWGRGRTELLAIFAHQVATSAEPFYVACCQARVRHALDGKGPIPSSLELYVDPRKVWNVVIGTFSCAFPQRVMHSYENAVNPFERIHKRIVKTKWVRQRELNQWFEEGRRACQRFYAVHLRELRNEVNGSSSATPRIAKSKVESPEFQFFFRVYLPCWLEYRIHFPVLLAQATKGNLQTENQIAAFENLLRIDKFCIVYPPVANLYSMVMKSKNNALINRLQGAHAGEPKQVTRRKIEITLGSLIQIVAKGLDDAIGKTWEKWRQLGIKGKRNRVRVTAPDILKLFDAADSDFGREKSDEDQEIEPHSYYMALERDKELWREPDEASQKLKPPCEGIEIAESVLSRPLWLESKTTRHEPSLSPRKGTS